MKTINQWASVIAEFEGKKHQSSIGDIREILKIIVDLDAKGSSILTDLCILADEKAKQKKKKAKKK